MSISRKMKSIGIQGCWLFVLFIFRLSYLYSWFQSQWLTMSWSYVCDFLTFYNFFDLFKPLLSSLPFLPLYILFFSRNCFVTSLISFCHFSGYVDALKQLHCPINSFLFYPFFLLPQCRLKRLCSYISNIFFLLMFYRHICATTYCIIACGKCNINTTKNFCLTLSFS